MAVANAKVVYPAKKVSRSAYAEIVVKLRLSSIVTDLARKRAGCR